MEWLSILNHTTAASSTFKYQVGANGGQTIAVDFGDFTNTGSGVMQLLNSSHASISAGTTASAITTGSAAVTAIDSAIASVNSQRSTFGAAVNQLTYAVDNLASVKVNAEASRSRILDTDYAAETSGWLARKSFNRRAQRCWRKQTSCLRRCSLCCNEPIRKLEKRPAGRFFLSEKLLP